MNSKSPKWQHPGGKLRELGAEALTDAELLACLISTGIPGKPAESIADNRTTTIYTVSESDVTISEEVRTVKLVWERAKTCL